MKLAVLAGGTLVAWLVALPSARAEPHDGEPKSATVATSLALGGSLLGPALWAVALTNGTNTDALHGAFAPLVVSGSIAMVFGPSLGNWYAHQSWSTGLGLRLAGGASFGLGASMLASTLFEDGHSANNAIAAVFVVAGMATFATGTVLDVVEAHRAVRTYNREHAAPSVMLTPVVSRVDGATHTGLAVVGAF